MRALHLVVTRAAGIKRGAAVFAGTHVPVRDLIDHLDRGGDLNAFLERNPSLPPALALEACALGLEALAAQVPLDPPETQRTPPKAPVTSTRNDMGTPVTSVACWASCTPADSASRTRPLRAVLRTTLAYSGVAPGIVIGSP